MKDQTMVSYIGTKNILARPMTLGDYSRYNKHQGWDIPTNQDAKEGYLVEYLDGGKPNHEDHKSYISWSPKEVFENAYRTTVGMTFGYAVEAMKIGKKVSRTGWNGKNMYATLMPGYPEGIEVNEVTQKAHNLPAGSKLIYRPYYQLWTAQQDVAMWSPSTSDTLAEDWYIVE